MRTVQVLSDCIDLDILFLFFRKEENYLSEEEPLGMHHCQVFRTCPAKGILKQYTWLE